jgi:hypothetical protein
MSTGTALSASIRPTTFFLPLGVWVVMAVLAVANGVFREVALIPRIGEYPGHVLSTAILVTAILVVAWLFFGWMAIQYSQAERLVIGNGGSSSPSGSNSWSGIWREPLCR